MNLLRFFLQAAILGAICAATTGYAATPRDTLVVAKNIDDVLTLDPAESSEASTGEILTNAYVRLVRPNLTDFSAVVGDAAEAWQVSSDGKTYTFRLREGLKFASGRAMTPYDVVYSLQRVILLNKSPAYQFAALFGWTKDNVKERVTADGESVVLRVRDAIARELVLQVLSSTSGSIVDAEEVRRHEKDGDQGNGWLRTAWAGSGPFRIVDWRAKDSVVLESNPTYFLGKPHLRRIIFRNVPESATQALLIAKGDIDIASALQADQIQQLTIGRDLTLFSTDRLTQIYVPLNQRNPALANPKVREALNLLIDYDGIKRNLLRDQWSIHQSFYGVGVMGALQDQPYRLNVPRARQLLAQAGYSDGLTINLDVENAAPYPDIAQSIQSTFKQGGVQLNLLVSDRRQVVTKYRARGHDAILWHASMQYADPHAYVLSFLLNEDNSEGAKLRNRAWRSNWQSEEVNQLGQEALYEKDAVKRRQRYVELQRKARSDAPYLFLFQQKEQLVLRSNVRGLAAGPTYTAMYYANVRKN